MSEMDRRKHLEQELSDRLNTDMDRMTEQERAELARKNILHKYEQRIQTELDPIVEKTIRYREMAEEVDDRYDKYMKKTETKDEDRDDRDR